MSDIKSNLRNFYNLEAKHRNANEKQDWKIAIRKAFCDLVLAENKKTLLELGAGTGNDSVYFMDCGLEVLAVDLSSEMVKICREKDVNSHELDFYDIHTLRMKFDCVWAMNSLLHVPKADLNKVLRGIDNVLNENGLFYMGVYDGENKENERVNDLCDIPRFFSFYCEEEIQKVLRDVFEIVHFEQFDVGRNVDFQSIVMRKKESKL